MLVWKPPCHQAAYSYEKATQPYPHLHACAQIAAADVDFLVAEREAWLEAAQQVEDEARAARTSAAQG